MLFGLVDLKFSDYFTLRASSTTRGHDYKLYQTYSKLNVCKYFFCERVVHIWNNLECNVIDFSSLQRFKTSLLSCNLNRCTHFKFSLVYVVHCFNFHCLHILNIVLWFVMHVSGQYWPFAFISIKNNLGLKDAKLFLQLRIDLEKNTASINNWTAGNKRKWEQSAIKAENEHVVIFYFK